MIKLFRFAIPVFYCMLFIGGNGLYAQSTDFYAIDTIQEIKISFESEDWRMQLDSLRFNGSELLPANISINGMEFEEVGVRIKNDRVFLPDEPKNSLFIRLDHTKPDQKYAGQRAIMLSLSLRDPSMVREVLGLELARKYMPAPRANYAKVTVNGEYYGLFANLEPIDDVFLEKNFGSIDGRLFYSNPPSNSKKNDGCQSSAYGNLLPDKGEACYDKNFNLVRGDNFSTLISLIEALDNGQDLEKILDIDRTLWMLAFQNITANLASYIGKEAPNYFLYQGANGQFTPILWNLNFAFGSYKNIGKGSDLSSSGMERLDPYLHINNDRKPLVKQLLSNPVYKRMYLSHMRTILYQEFLSGDFEKRAKELQELIKVPLINDRNRYYTSSDYDKSLVAK